MKKFLLDVNLSPKTGGFLTESFGFDVVHADVFLPAGEPDESIVALAIKQQRIIVTLDLDFGEIYFLRERGKLGVIVLRLRNQTRKAVNKRLVSFFQFQAPDIDLETSLVIIDEHQVRIVTS